MSNSGSAFHKVCWHMWKPSNCDQTKTFRKFWLKELFVAIVHYHYQPTLECSQSQICYTHIITQDYKSLYCCGRLQIKCINATSYDLHVNVFTILKVCWLFLHQIHFLFTTHPHTFRHLVAPAQQILGDFRCFWLANSSLQKRAKFGSLDMQVKFARGHEWPAEHFFFLFELKPTRLQSNESHSEIRVNFHSFAFKEYFSPVNYEPILRYARFTLIMILPLAIHPSRWLTGHSSSQV